MTRFKSSDWESTDDLMYIVDNNLDLLEVNDPWWRFSGENGSEPALGDRQRVNALDSMSGSHRVLWRELYNLLLSGQISEYRDTFSCPSPTLERTYQLTIRPLLSQSGEVDYLEHRTHLLFTKPGSKRRQAGIESPKASELDSGYEQEHPVRIASFCRPLGDRGGDLVWTHHESETRAWWLIADAMGHDEQAAAAAERLRDLIADDLSGSPKTVIERINKKFFQARQDDDDGMFVTGILCLTDLDLNQVRVCSFGHDGFLTTKSGSMRLEGGAPVGLMDEAGPWPEQVLSTSAIGARGLMFTDGLIEQFNSEGTMYSTERLLDTFVGTMHLSMPESFKKIFESVDEFRGEAAVKDDQTILGFEFRKRPAS